MKSIRLSLIVYFLALLALALGGVSALYYQTTFKTLHDKQASTENLILSQFEKQCQQARSALDRRLLRQAQLLASKATTPQVPASTIYFSSAAASYAGPFGRMLSPLLLAPAMSQPGDFQVNLANYMAFRLGGGVRLVELRIPSTAVDAYMPMEDDHPLEVFQTYRWNGAPAQRSPSLRDYWMTLADSSRTSKEELHEEYDDIEIDGVELRRVTLKTFVARFYFGPNRVPGAGLGAKSKAGTKPPSIVPGTFRSPFFIQYSADVTGVNEQIREFAATRDARLARSVEETQEALAHVRSRLFWISLLTFIGILLGVWLVLRLGLAPLSRLSDAVSKVSERNFELQLDADKLPVELRPIAQRLSQSLALLQQAFLHEKQAAADISHELRTPLAALMTTLDVALRKQRSAQEYQDILEECRSSGRHMAHLVERLMVLARLDAGVERLSLEPVDVAELAQQCTDMVRALAEEQGLELRILAAEPAVTLSDAGKLREIVLNLLHNAIAYNKPQGSIEVSVDRLGDSIRLAVRDTGIGIAPETQPRLFERFFRADPSRHADTPHCGLGLAIVKSYVDLLGGSIKIESSPAGSTFSVCLPLRQAPAPTHAEPEMQVVGS